ncbi:MAG: Na+/H+ antiporter subunit A [Propionibacteriaceae bacterium]|nr:Na+/H+ antiporter subunit A [Propionibacteriaceae bacterium]
MLALLVIHFLAYTVSPLLVRIFGRRAFWALLLPNVGTAIWAISKTPEVLGGEPPVQSWQWIPGIQLTIDLRMDVLSWVLTLIISMIGVLVLGYCAGYFEDSESDLGRFAAHLTAFSGVMLGLAWSDNLLLLYLFWELTTVLSYLLVGHLSHKQESRQAATQALVVTTFGGLAMLVGMIMLGLAADSYRISEIIAAPPEPSPAVAAAVVLILIGAISKSALVPFHFWLPGAMAAPTPVSAYLHAAAMVKAGIYLVARFSSAFAGRPEWLITVLVLGGATMIIGGYRALRQHDLKLLLAYGTVSQLGFLVILFGWGTQNAALAGLTMLVAHAVFKASLFLTVGAIDHATGTRDLRILDSLGRRMPVLAVCSTLAAASMAGVPPLLGFVGKEAAYASLLHGAGRFNLLMLAVVFVGSVFTFAYSARFVYGAWGPATEEADAPIEVQANPWAVTAAPVFLGVLGLLLAPPSALAEPMFGLYTARFPAEDYAAHLGLWHGLNLVLLLSLVTLALGAILFALRIHIEQWQREAPHVPAAVSGYRWVMKSLDRTSLEVTGLLHRGSLPLSLSLILLVLIVIPGGAMVLAGMDVLGAGIPVGIKLFENPAQLLVAVVVAVAAVAAVNSLRRLRAVFLVAVTGYGVAMLFLLHGAPDLALTQVLVETVSLVVFVLVLRRFSSRFPDVASGRVRAWRIALGVFTGLVFAGVALLAPMGRTAAPDSTDMPQSAVEFGGGYNIVNVILVDIRAWDTMGEISVVLVAATGVASLIFLQSTNLSRVRLNLAAARAKRFVRSSTVAEVGWLSEVRAVPGERRSLMFEVVTRLVFHAVMLWSLYLLFTGHNDPGGGFAGGLVAGLGLTIRYLAGGAAELRAAMPVMPGALLGSGLFLSAGAGLVSMLVGGQVLESWTFDIGFPVIGNIHIVTSMFFDIGVYLVVIGLMLDVLRSLGSSLDYRIAESEGRAIVPGDYEPMGERR